MTRADIIRIIEDNLVHLKNLGVQSLALFGSAARDEVGPASDVDVLIEFEGRATFDAFSVTNASLLRNLPLSRRPSGTCSCRGSLRSGASAS